MATKGFIYVAFNESMQGLLNIDRSKNHPDQRMQELAGTGYQHLFTSPSSHWWRTTSLQSCSYISFSMNHV